MYRFNIVFVSFLFRDMFSLCPYIYIAETQIPYIGIKPTVEHQILFLDNIEKRFRPLISFCLEICFHCALTNILLKLRFPYIGIKPTVEHQILFLDNIKKRFRSNQASIRQIVHLISSC